MAVGLILTHLVDTAKERLPCLPVNVHVLFIRGNVGNDEHLRETRLTVEVAAREKQRIAVQIIQHIAVLQTRTELLENDNVLSVVGTKGCL